MPLVQSDQCDGKVNEVDHCSYKNKSFVSVKPMRWDCKQSKFGNRQGNNHIISHLLFELEQSKNSSAPGVGLRFYHVSSTEHKPPTMTDSIDYQNVGRSRRFASQVRSIYDELMQSNFKHFSFCSLLRPHRQIGWFSIWEFVHFFPASSFQRCLVFKINTIWVKLFQFHRSKRRGWVREIGICFPLNLAFLWRAVGGGSVSIEFDF